MRNTEKSDSRFDVFLCHNDKDKPFVKSIDARLKENRLNPFLDKWKLLSGWSFLEKIEVAFNQSSSCAVFIGPHGIGPIQKAEIDIALIRQLTEGNFAVIPVLLPGASKGNMSRFLSRNTWVDFRDGTDNDDEFKRLIAAIKGDLQLLTEYDQPHLSSLAMASKDSQPSIPALSFEVIKTALLQASTPLLHWPTTLTDGRWIDRNETNRIIKKIETEETSSTFLLGVPGSGKSALLAKISQYFLSNNVAILAIKADLIPSDVKTPEQLTKHLELPADPVSCIEVLSKLERVVLIADQLDALADLVDLHSHRLGLILNLIHKVSALPNVHIIASCRTFEHAHDPRLRNIEAESINLELPPKEEIAALLLDKGIQTTGWPQDFIEILQTPQYLRIFMDFNYGTTEPEIFQTSQAMLDKLWEENIINAGNACIELVDTLAATMAEKEELWLPVARFQDRLLALRHLEAAGILVFDDSGQRVGFSHQTLFEYARARAFVRVEGSLSNYVLQRQNGLFVRPQLWNALNYLRTADPTSYKREVGVLWNNDGLRLHIRILIMEFLSQLTNPQEFEAHWLLPCLEQPRFRQRIFSCMTGSKGWFDLIADSLLPVHMTQLTEQAFAVVSLLQSAVGFAKDKVLILIEKYWLYTSDKDNLSLSVLDYLKDWDEKALNMACVIFRRTDIADHWVQSLVALISEHAPQLAPGLLRAHLDKLLLKAHQEASKELPIIPETATEDEQMLYYLTHGKNKAYQQLLESDRGFYELPTVAEAAPMAFLNSVWPWFVQVLTLAVNEPHHIRDGYRDDYSLATNLDGNVDGVDEYPLVSAIGNAVSQLVSQDSDAFLAFYQKWKDEDLLVVQRLLARGLSRLSDSHPIKIYEFLVEDRRRLILGGYQDQHSDTKALIKLVVPRLDKEKLLKLETALCDFNMYKDSLYEESPNLRLDRIKYNRQDRLRLLRAFPREYMSKKTCRLLEEEERAFPNLDDQDVHFTGFHFVGSPMAANQMEKGHDEDILGLFEDLGSKSDHHPKTWLRGGSIQASQAFEELAKNYPARAISLIFKMTPEKHNLPVSYAIEGLGNSSLSTAELFNVISSLVRAGFDSDDFHFHSARAIGGRLNSATLLPTEFFEMLEGWLKSHEHTKTTSATEDKPDNGSVLWRRNRTIRVPHGNYPILETLSRACLLAKPPLMDRWLAILEYHLSHDENPYVWKVLSLHFLPNLALAEKERSERFLGSLFSKYPEVMNSTDGAVLIARTQSWVNEVLVSTWLARLKDSDWSRGAQAYAEIVLLRHAWVRDCVWAKDGVELIRSGNCAEPIKMTNLRVGLAYTAVELWSEFQYRELGTEIILDLIGDTDERIQKAVSKIFGRPDALLFDDCTKKILDAVYEHPNILMHERTGYLLETLENMVMIDPDRVYRLCSVIVNQLGKELTDFRQRSAMWSENIINIALALQRLDEPHRERGLELFEKLLDMGVWSVRETLLELDRRLVPNSLSRPRRRRKQRKSGSSSV